MLGFKTEGIILKRRDFGEADRILTVFSLSRGKITILAKGVRRITSRRAGNIELLNRVQMYLHPGKNFLILTEATALDTFQKIKEDLTLSTYAYHILELVDKLTAENQENRDLYEGLVQVLRRMEVKPRQILIRAFETKILSLMGFWSLEQVKDLNKNIKEILNLLELSPWDKIDSLVIDKNQAMELERVLRYYLERVIEGSLKSRQFLKEI